MNFNKDFYRKKNTTSFSRDLENENIGYRNDEELVTFIKATYKLFGATMFAGAVAAVFGLGMAGLIASNYWIFFGIELVLLFTLSAVQDKSPLNLIVLFGFAFFSGLTLVPLLAKFLGMAGGASIIINAFVMTTIIFVALSVFAIKTPRDFTSMGKPLFITFLVIFAFSLLNIFIFHSPILFILIQGVAVFLFSFFIIYDTQNIIQGNYQTPVQGAVALYLDFLNLFITLLQIFGILSDDD